MRETITPMTRSRDNASRMTGRETPKRAGELALRRQADAFAELAAVDQRRHALGQAIAEPRRRQDDIPFSGKLSDKF